MSAQTASLFILLEGYSTLTVNDLHETNPDFVENDFWIKFYVESERVGQEARKLWLIREEGVSVNPSDLILGSFCNMVNAVLGFPTCRGHRLSQTIVSHVAYIASALLQFLREDGGREEGVGAVGRVVSLCEEVRKLPTSADAAVTTELLQVFSLVTDALQELHSEVKRQKGAIAMTKRRRRRESDDEADDEDEGMWSEDQLAVASSLRDAVRLTSDILLQASKLVSSVSIQGAVEKEEEERRIKLLDRLDHISHDLSPAVDDSVVLFYSPVDLSSLPPLVDTLLKTQREMLNILEQLKPIPIVEDLKNRLNDVSANLSPLLVSEQINRLAIIS